MTKAGFGRRIFLRGVGGVVVGLPLLESLAAPTRVSAASSRSFAIWVRQANGVAQADNGEPERFWLRNRGPITREGMMGETDRALSVLADHAADLLIVSGLRFGFPGNGCGHSGGGNQVLTAARVSDSPSGNESLAMGESVDNRVATALQAPGTEPLTLMTGRRSSYLGEVLSYRGPRDLRAAEPSPYSAYMRLFGLADADASVQNATATRRRSVNDLVRGQLQALLGRDLSRADRDRIDLHLTSIRDLEVQMTERLPPAEEDALRTMQAMERHLDEGNFQAVARMHADVIAIAVAAGHVRSATLQLGNGNDGSQFRIPGYRGGEQLPRFHQISHRIYSDGAEGPPIEGAQEMHFEIDKMHGELFGYLIERLRSYTFEDGTLLSQGVACWTNDLGAGVSHTYDNVPFVLAGSAGGNLAVGNYVDARGSGSGREVTHNKLFNTVLTAIGVRKADGTPVDDFGDPSLSGGFVDSMIAASAPDF